MSATARSASSTLLKLVGYAGASGGLALGAAALMADAGELQVYFSVIAAGGLLIAVVGGVAVAIGALLSRRLPKAAAPSLSPEEQQLRDSREFLARQSGDGRG